jgi:membrane protein
MIRGVSIRQFFSDLNREISEDKVFNGAAALAYYLTLAIFPALILMMTLIPYLPIDRVDEAIMDLLRQALPAESHEMVAGVVHEVTAERRGGLLSFGLLGTLWAASTGMHAVMQQLNVTYDVEESRGFIRARGTALILSILFILLVIGAFSLIVLGGVLEGWLESQLGFGAALLVLFATLRWALIVLALLLAFAMIYRYAPNVQRKFAFFSPGSVIGVVLLIVASLGFALYTSNFGDYDATYGSLGAMIMLMLWLYIAGLVILVGSEVNVLLERYGSQRRQRDEARASPRRRHREYSWR